jgi:hypothetical protein
VVLHSFCWGVFMISIFFFFKEGGGFCFKEIGWVGVGDVAIIVINIDNMYFMYFVFIGFNFLFSYVLYLVYYILHKILI